MLHLYRSSEELGKQMSLFHFYFILFCVIYISTDGSVIFAVLFGTFLNLMYCMVVFLRLLGLQTGRKELLKLTNKNELFCFVF